MTNQRRRSSDMRSTDGSPAEIPIAEPSRTDAPLTPAYDSSTPLRADATDADIKSRVAAVRFMDMDYRSVALAVARELASAVSADKDAELRSFRLHVLHCHEDDCDVCMGIADVGPLAEQEALALDGLTLMEKAAKCVSMLAKMNAPKDLPVSALPSPPARQRHHCSIRCATTPSVIRLIVRIVCGALASFGCGKWRRCTGGARSVALSMTYVPPPFPRQQSSLMLSKKPDRCPECDRLLLSVDGKFDVGDKQHLPRTNFTCPNCGWKCTVKA